MVFFRDRVSLKHTLPSDDSSRFTVFPPSTRFVSPAWLLQWPLLPSFFFFVGEEKPWQLIYEALLELPSWNFLLGLVCQSKNVAHFWQLDFYISDVLTNLRTSSDLFSEGKESRHWKFAMFRDFRSKFSIRIGINLRFDESFSFQQMEELLT